MSRFYGFIKILDSQLHQGSPLSEKIYKCGQVAMIKETVKPWPRESCSAAVKHKPHNAEVVGLNPARCGAFSSLPQWYVLYGNRYLVEVQHP